MIFLLDKDISIYRFIIFMFFYIVFYSIVYGFVYVFLYVNF